MYLKALEIQGFKSFPDKTVLNFGEDITAIVGPNGSGKSNISDAIRWVMGEQNSRQLRGAKMEDVIFGGTEKRNQMGFAQVTLVIDNTEHIFPTREEAEVAVTRRYYRSGESEYYINKQSVRLKDVNELFMDTGMGREGYSIIGQGRIDEILSQKSGDRREIFEEAAGISRFRYRKEETERKLERTEENLVRINDKIAELELQVEPLRAQAETAKQYLIYRDELRLLEISVWLENLETLKTNAIKLDTDLSLAREELKKANADLEALYAASEQFSARIHENDIAQEEKRAQLSELDAQVKEQESAVAVLQTGIAHNEENITRVEEELRSQSDRVGSMDAQIAQQRARIEELERSKNEVETALSSLLKQAEELSKNAGEAASEAETLRGREALALSAAADSRAEVAALRSTLSEMDERESAIAAEQESGEAQLSDTRKSAAENRKALETAQEEADAIRNIIAGHTMKMQGRVEREKETSEQHVSLTMEMNNLDSRIRLLSEMEKEYEGFNKAVRTVMQASERKALRGVRGPVANLMKVDKKYAVAIEIALGAGLQNIVVEREEDAKSAIQLLKQRDGGRATFLPLSSIRGEALRDARVQNEYGYVGLASELVEYDREYDGIFKNLLGRTVVVEDLDCGITISRRFSNAFRIVTLDGQVLNRGGSMTGGSRGQNAGILSRGNDIEQLKKTVAKLEKDLAERQKRYKELAGEVSAAQAEYDGVTAELQKAQEEKIRREGELRMIDDKIETAESALNDLEAEKRSSAERTAKLEEIQTQAQKKIDEFTSQLDSVNEKITEIESRRDELLSTREQNADKESSINLSILAFKKDIQAREEVIETLKRRRSSHEGHADELKSEIDSITEQMTATNELIEQLKGEAASLRAEAQQKKDEISSLAQKRSGVEGESTKLRAQERSVSDRRERLSGERARLEERRDSMQRELENAQNKLYDEYQLTRREAEELGIIIEDPQKAQRDLNDIKNKIRALGNVNVGAIEEYKEVSERYEFMKTQIDDVESSRAELLTLIGDLTGKMSERFREQFDRINTIFGQTFSELFGGGKAELILENPLDVLECAIEIKVQPPGKNVQNIDLLSGGEKGLAAIALLFSILKVTPAPFCFFDEVEAALDDVNVTRYAQYARRMTKNTQFILITHRRGTMEEADVLYGVTMQEDGVSKLLELKTAEMAKKLGLTQ